MNFPLAVIDACADVIKKSDSSSFILGYRLSPEEIEVPGIRMADHPCPHQRIKQKANPLPPHIIGRCLAGIDC